MSEICSDRERTRVTSDKRSAAKRDARVRVVRDVRVLGRVIQRRYSRCTCRDSHAYPSVAMVDGRLECGNRIFEFTRIFLRIVTCRNSVRVELEYSILVSKLVVECNMNDDCISMKLRVDDVVHM